MCVRERFKFLVAFRSKGLPSNLSAQGILAHLRANRSAIPFDYSPISRREPLRLPNGARVAVWVVPNIEVWTTDRPAVSMSPTDAIPDIRNYAWRDYSLRCGIWRLMKVMDKYNVRGTVALNSAVCTYYPQVVEECLKRNWELMGHGISNSWNANGINRSAEQSIVREAIKTLKKFSGKAPEGWLSPGLTETNNTLSLLAENGINYVCDWCNDEQPFQMKVGKRKLISIPYSLEIHDLSMFLRLQKTPREFYEICVDNFDTLYDEGQENARVMCIALHPFIIGHPFRAKYLDRVLEHIVKHDKVWLATGSEIAHWYSSQV
jgi:allantoinase